jgi:trimethylamine:corrinoid methyltransferase-like protein
MITHTRKPLAAWASDVDTLKAIYEIAKCVKGSERDLIEKPNFVYFSTFQSPLQHLDNKIDSALWAAEHGIPVIYLGGPTVGMESPITGASGLVIYLAAALERSCDDPAPTSGRTGSHRRHPYDHGYVHSPTGLRFA